jgi:hypothetical protein
MDTGTRIVLCLTAIIRCDSEIDMSGLIGALFPSVIKLINFISEIRGLFTLPYTLFDVKYRTHYTSGNVRECTVNNVYSRNDISIIFLVYLI